MRMFDLYRMVDETGVSGTGIVAQGVEFDDGSCAMRWATEHKSTALYDNIDTLKAIHGHNGKTRIVYRGRLNTHDRARVDCMQDASENCPFASIGGLGARSEPRAPDYIAEDEREEYLRGYTETARQMYGEDWATCSFGWAPAMTING
jgi:hypothetical protein